MEFINEWVNKISNLLGVSILFSYIILGAGVLFAILLVVLTIVGIVRSSRNAKAKKQKQATAEVSEEVVRVDQNGNINVSNEEKVLEQEKVSEKESEKAIEKSPKTSVKAKELSQKKTVKTLNGKWVVEIKRDKEYIAKLVASNGEVMLNSEVYSTEDGARTGIATIVGGITNGNFVVYNVKSGEYFFKLKNANNKLLCAGEIYKTKEGCLSAIETVKRIAQKSPINEDVVSGNRFIDYTPIAIDENALNGAKGKWKIEKTEEGKFSAKLYANNGQLMLATEEVVKKTNASNAIENVKKNALAGNFIIDKDKFGKFYYKLRNSQKSVICIGEAYDSLDSCISALESVRRFALNSPIV